MNKPRTEWLLYALVLLLSAVALILVAYGQCFETSTKVVYQGF